MSMTFITDFADQAVILPLVLAIGIGLLLQGWGRGAIAWAFAVVATFAAMLALKLLCMACASSFGTSDLHTPSGHVAAATVVTGGLAALLLRRHATVLPLAALAALVVGVSRLALGAHSLPEVALGAVVGLAGAYALQWIAGPPPANLNVRRIVGIAGVTVVVFHGMHFPAEAHIRATAFRFAQSFAVCQPDGTRL
jgi:membrane-associated phospholipid phosphatase